MSKLYYIQDTRQVVGNCAAFWAKDACGYVCDLSQAHVYTQAEVDARDWRDTDVPLAKDEVDALVIQHVRVEPLRSLRARRAQKSTQ